MSSTTPQQLRLFLTELEKLPKQTQLCLARLLSEIDELGLGQIGECPWRESDLKLLESLICLRIIAPSVTIVKHENIGKEVIHVVHWNKCEFHMPYCPDLFLLWHEVTQKATTHRGSLKWSVMV